MRLLKISKRNKKAMPYRTVSSEKTGRTSYAALEMGSPKPYNTLCRKMKKKGSQRREIPFFSGSRAGVGAMEHRLVSSGFIPFGDVLSLLLL